MIESPCHPLISMPVKELRQLAVSNRSKDGGPRSARGASRPSASRTAGSQKGSLSARTNRPSALATTLPAATPIGAAANGAATPGSGRTPLPPTGPSPRTKADGVAFGVPTDLRSEPSAKEFELQTKVLQYGRRIAALCRATQHGDGEMRCCTRARGHN